MNEGILSQERTRLLKNYILISLVAITLDLIVFYILIDIVQLNYLFSVIFSFGTGKLTVYALNKKYNFRDKNKVREQFLAFLAILFIGLILTQFLLLVFVEFIFLNEIIARSLVLPIVGIFHFWAHKNITFKKKGDSFYLHKEENRAYVLNGIGFLFLIIGTVAYYTAFIQNNFELIFWLCYLNLMILGVGVLARDDRLIVSMLNIMSIPLIIWSIDFIFLIITRTPLLGITDYFLTPGPLVSKLVTMQHLITVPLSLYALSLIKIKRKGSVIVSFVVMAAMFLVTRVFTTPENNVNCVFSNCMNFTLAGPHVLNWFVAVVILIFVTNKIIVNISFLQGQPS